MARKGTTRYDSNLQESRVAKIFGGKKQIASGSLWFLSADVRTDKFLIECKTTEKDKYTVTLKVWDKIRIEAARDGLRSPLLIVTISGEDFAVFSSKEFEEVVEPELSVLGNPPLLRCAGIHSKSFVLRKDDDYGYALLGDHSVSFCKLSVFLRALKNNYYI